MQLTRITRIKNSNFTTVSNTIAKDPRISLKAKGLLLVIMSLPDNWDFTINGIISILKESRDSVTNAIKELKEYGYCESEMIKEKGKFVGYKYFFREDPIKKPLTENPLVDKPLRENQQQLSTNKSKERKSNKIVSTGLTDFIQNVSFDIIIELFDKNKPLGFIWTKFCEFNMNRKFTTEQGIVNLIKFFNTQMVPKDLPLYSCPGISEDSLIQSKAELIYYTLKLQSLQKAERQVKLLNRVSEDMSRNNWFGDKILEKVK